MGPILQQIADRATQYRHLYKLAATDPVRIDMPLEVQAALVGEILDELNIIPMEVTVDICNCRWRLASSTMETWTPQWADQDPNLRACPVHRDRATTEEVT